MKDDIIFYTTCLVLLITSVKGSFFPEYHEITYKYKATVKTFTNKPTSFDSVYHLSADLKTVNYGNYTIIDLENVIHKQYLGRKILKEYEDLVATEIPEELMQPFVIEYDNIGKSVALFTEATDVSWSINIKKALAFILQADVNFGNHSSIGYYVNEQSVYGSCPVFYTTYPSPSFSNKFILKKHITPTKCDGFKLRTTSNMSPDNNCKTPHDDLLTMTLDRQYEVSKRDGGKFIFDSIKSVSTVTLAAFGGDSDTYVMEIDQDMILHKITELAKVKKLNFHGITYTKLKSAPVTDDVESLYDMIGGRAIYDSKMIINTIIDGIKSIIERLDGDGKITIPGSSPTVEYVMQQLRLLNKTELSICYDLLKMRTGKESNIFLQLLPAVGTYSSVLLIRDMVTTKSVNDDVEEMLVSKFPFHLKKSPDMALLEELSVLKRNGTSSGVLAFATVLSKALDKNPKNPALNNFVDEYIDDFKSAQSCNDRQLYLSALYNIKSKKVSTFLLSVVTKYETVQNLTTHHRSLAIWILSNHHYAPSDMNVYWPLLQNLDEPLEIRSAALVVLLTRPTLQDLLRMYHYITNPVDDTLYKLFFSRVDSLSRNKAPCYKAIATNAKKFIQMVQRPEAKNSISFDHTFIFFNSKFQFGKTARVVLIGNLFKDNFTTIILDFSHQNAYHNLRDYTIYIHVTLKPSRRPDYVANFKIERGSTLRKIFSIMLSGFSNIEVINIVNDRIVSTTKKSSDEFKPKNLAEYFKAKVEIDGEAVFTTDLGVPGKLFYQNPTFRKLNYEYKFANGINGVTTFILDLFYANQHIYGLKVYNPILDNWHGIKRNHNWKVALPINLEFKLTEDNQISIVSMNQTWNDKIKGFEFESSAYSEVFTEDTINGTLNSQIVTEGETHQRNEVMWEHDCKLSNTQYQLSMRQCERSLTGSRVKMLKQSFFGDDNNGWDKHPLGKLLEFTGHIWSYAAISPSPGMCVMSITAKPNYSNMRLSVAHKSDETFYNVTALYNSTYFDDENKWWEFKLSNSISINPRSWMFASLRFEKKKYCFEQETIKFNREVRLVSLLTGGDTDSDNCPKDQVTIETKGISKYSKDHYDSSNNHDSTFDECRKYEGLSLKCIAEQSQMEQFSYNIKTENVSRLVRQYWATGVGFLTRISPEYGIIVQDSSLENNSLNVIFNYGNSFSKETDITIETFSDTKHFGKVNFENGPLSWILGRKSEIVDTMDLVRYENTKGVYSCSVTSDRVKNFYQEEINNYLSSDWQKIVGIDNEYCSDNSCMFEFYVKKINDNELTVQLIYPENPFTEEGVLKSTVLEISPKFELTINGRSLEGSKPGHYRNSGMVYKITKKHLFLGIYDLATYLVHSRDSLEIHVVNNDFLSGVCAHSDKYWH